VKCNQRTGIGLIIAGLPVYEYFRMQGDAMVNNDNPAATDPEDGGIRIQEAPHLILLLPSTDNMEVRPS